MGVLQCDRNNCDNIMCDRLSPTYGYICDTCFDELVLVQVIKDTDIKEFMLSCKKESERELFENYHDEIFPKRELKEKDNEPTNTML